MLSQDKLVEKKANVSEIVIEETRQRLTNSRFHLISPERTLKDLEGQDGPRLGEINRAKKGVGLGMESNSMGLPRD